MSNLATESSSPVIETSADSLQDAGPEDASSPERTRTVRLQHLQHSGPGDAGSDTTRLIQLQQAIKSLSSASSSRIQLRSLQIESILEQARLTISKTHAADQHERVQCSQYEQELEWLLVSKATAQTYGLVLTVLLEQTIPISQDIWYWEEVRASYAMTGLYSMQTTPERIWRWVHEIYREAWPRLQLAWDARDAYFLDDAKISGSWARYYALVRETVRERSLANVQSQIMSPLTKCRAEVKSKQDHLKRLREMSAAGLGMLMDEGLTFDVDDDAFKTSKISTVDDRDEWRSVVAKSVALMEIILQNATVLELGPSEFEETVFMSVEDDPEIIQNRTAEEQLCSKPVWLAGRLQQVLFHHMPRYEAASARIVSVHGRPSRTVRYWIPAAIVLLSSSTLLRIFFNHKADVIAWVQDLGSTTRDFWYNWVVEPVKKIIGTIRHDETSEVAIMSKGSLEGDRASLERMVVDFVKDHSSDGTIHAETDISEVRAKIKEGDLTPILRAYEKDLRRPFIGTIRGDLIRALLIQIQKTKVDVEIALGGIDALLKSQELVFGFVGLTPGLLVCLGVFRWLGGFLGGQMKTKAVKQGQLSRTLRYALSPGCSLHTNSACRNIDRILSAANPATNGILSYKDHGLLLCEIHILRHAAQKILPSEINAEFLEDLDDLVDLRTGVERQLRVVDRIRWAYAHWLPL